MKVKCGLQACVTEDLIQKWQLLRLRRSKPLLIMNCVWRVCLFLPVFQHLILHLSVSLALESCSSACFSFALKAFLCLKLKTLFSTQALFRLCLSASLLHTVSKNSLKGREKSKARSLMRPCFSACHGMICSVWKVICFIYHHSLWTCSVMCRNECRALNSALSS